jgi:hypothetical protein
MYYGRCAEYQAIDQLYQLQQKYNETHIIITGGDINEDLNEPTSTKRNLYLRDFINECCLKFLLPFAGTRRHADVNSMFELHLSLISTHCILSDPKSIGFIMWSISFFYKMATPPYPRGMHIDVYQQKGVKAISQNTKKQLINYMSFIKNTMKPIKLSYEEISTKI